MLEEQDPFWHLEEDRYGLWSLTSTSGEGVLFEDAFKSPYDAFDPMPAANSYLSKYPVQRPEQRVPNLGIYAQATDRIELQQNNSYNELDLLSSLFHDRPQTSSDSTFHEPVAPAQCPPCCGSECPAYTVPCTDKHCNEPNWCEEPHFDSPCNDLDCHEPPCHDTTCPESLAHLDTCFENDCIPSGWMPSDVISAPCEDRNCGGTFVTDTCSDFDHLGWDPTCPNATLRPQDILHHQYPHAFPYASGPSAARSGVRRPIPPAGHDLSDEFASWNYLSPALLQRTTYEASENDGFNLTQTQLGAMVIPGLSTPLSPQRSPSKKRKRVESPTGVIEDLTTSPSVVRLSTPPPSLSETESTQSASVEPTPKVMAPTVCMWVVNPDDPSEQHRPCGFQAADAADLHAHITQCHTRQLTSKASFVCSWLGCERFRTQHFGQKSKLDRHVQTHDGHMPFSCDICGKRFITKDQRRNHQATHLNLQAWVCSECGKSFNAPTSLKTHMNIHTGRKPHHCWICGHRDGDSSNFSKHMKAKHPGEPKKRPPGFVEERDWGDFKGYVLEKDRIKVEN